MPLALPLTFASPAALVIAVVLVLATVVAVLVRRLQLPRVLFAMGAGGIVLLALAAGEPRWRRPAPGVVEVLVDLSPSTRTAGFRDRAALESRLRQLVGDHSYRITYFAGGIGPAPMTAQTLADLPAEKTVYPTPHEPVALLFSDCRFELPAAGPPTYVVVDAGLEAPPDGAVRLLEPRGEQLACTVRNDGGPRDLTLVSAGATLPVPSAAGAIVITRPLDPHAGVVVAQLNPGDPWPENDALTLAAPPAHPDAQWWAGPTDVGAGWTHMRAVELPSEGARYLEPSVIVLDNVAGPDLSDVQLQRLQQYVRDLGGTLLLLGGESAFAAGEWTGTTLDALSPLASTSPQPTTHWLLLADASGSMATPLGNSTRWRAAADAITALIPRLPPDDVLSVGSFSDTLRWWTNGRSVRESQHLPLPADVVPHGPTNLRDALVQLGSASQPKLPRQLLVLTDGNTDMGDAGELAAALKRQDIHLHVLAVGAGSGLAALKSIASATGGTTLAQLDPAAWTAAAHELLRSAAPSPLRHDPLTIRFIGELASLPPATTPIWNRTWLKRRAVRIAESDVGGERITGIARWNVGEGLVIAAAFPAGRDLVSLLAGRFARSPADPRLRVSWEAGPRLRATLDAVDAGKYLNGLDPTLELLPQSGSDRSPSSYPMPQSGPGRYELSLPAPRSPAFAFVRAEGRIAAHTAVAGRYAPEFDEIGNDHAAMHALARRTGGRVIAPGETGPIELRWPMRNVPLTSWLAAAGALLVAGGLVAWKRH